MINFIFTELRLISMIKISVVVPVYNMVNTINETLSSILNQNYKNLELIVIDGNSNDGTYN